MEEGGTPTSQKKEEVPVVEARYITRDIPFPDIKLPSTDVDALDMPTEPPSNSGTGFVTFTSKRAHALAYQVGTFIFIVY